MQSLENKIHVFILGLKGARTKSAKKKRGKQTTSSILTSLVIILQCFAKVQPWGRSTICFILTGCSVRTEDFACLTINFSLFSCSNIFYFVWCTSRIFWDTAHIVNAEGLISTTHSAKWTNAEGVILLKFEQLFIGATFIHTNALHV